MAISNVIRIDLEGQRDINANLTLSTGDTNAYGLVLEFYKNNKFYDVTGYNLAVYARRSGSQVPIPDIGRVENGKGYYVIKPIMYSNTGETQIEIALTDNLGMSFTSKVIHFNVRGGFASQSGLVDEADYSVLSLLIQQSQTSISQVNVATAYAQDKGDYAQAMGDEASAGRLPFVIAAANAVNKNRADLVLTGTNDAAAINGVFPMLDDLRGNNPNIAVRIDFMGGNIVLDNDARIVLEYDNFHIYGNGVKIVGEIGETLFDLQGNGYILSNVSVANVAGEGIRIANSALSNCTGSGEYAYAIHATNSTISNCTGNSEFGGGIFATNSTISNCTGNSEYGIGITARNTSIIQSCDCTVGGISVDNSCYPNTQDLLEQLNKGTITIE